MNGEMSRTKDKRLNPVKGMLTFRRRDNSLGGKKTLMIQENKVEGA